MLRNKGFSLVELLLALAITGVILAIALPSYQAYVDRVNVAQAVADINDISQALTRYYATEGRYPSSLAAINIALEDPWGNPYYYTNIADTRGAGGLRKDRNLVPINSDFDLYSAGKDGRTVAPLTASHSRDDIVRANNGGFVGLASDY